MLCNIPFKNIGFFSKTMLDYLNQNEKIRSFYTNFPSIEGFRKQISQKQLQNINRKVLVETLENQYKNIDISDKTKTNIKLLEQKNTFTITTGHQLNLFTGPLYFLYKIISTINLCEKLSKEFPTYNFVPIYWLATEDHDFEEINFFNFKGKKIKWSSEEKGAVGRFSTKGLDQIFEVFSSELNLSKNANELRELFKNGYLKHDNLANATRYITNELFKNYGLVIIDADDHKLKQEFSPYVKQELLEQIAYKEVTKTLKSFSKDYKVQVNPREINLFYLKNDLRERIIFEDKVYKINNTEIVFSQEEIIKELNNFPERFSPNVIMRPLYQEVVLPNLCYIGGGGELSYWLELKSYFKNVSVPYPILLLRNSVQIISEKQFKKLEKLNISVSDIFIKQNELIKQKVIENSINKVDFTEQKKVLNQQFSMLRDIAKQTDKSFINAVKAQEKKQLKGLETLEKRWLRAEKKQQKNLVDRIVNLQNELFPNQSLEERQRNFSEFYEEYGNEFISTLKQNLNPLKMEFVVLIK